ncbi:nucleotidyltransferase domain-containing protein [bacterium]|nr:nucleotidyltransferase domain-containing protein [bacterium]
MWLQCPLDDILATRTKVRILRLLATEGLALSGREIARRLGMVQSQVSVVIRQLVAAGVVEAQHAAPAMLYSFTTRGEPVAMAVRELFRQEQRRTDALVGALQEGVPGLLAVALFGSAARGTHRSDSDVDLLLVVERDDAEAHERIEQLLGALERDHIVPLSWLVADVAQLRAWEAADHPLWRNIQQDGIRLAGESPGWIVRHGTMADTVG